MRGDLGDPRWATTQRACVVNEASGTSLDALRERRHQPDLLRNVVAWHIVFERSQSDRIVHIRRMHSQIAGALVCQPPHYGICSSLQAGRQVSVGSLHVAQQHVQAFSEARFQNSFPSSRPCYIHCVEIQFCYRTNLLSKESGRIWTDVSPVSGTPMNCRLTCSFKYRTARRAFGEREALRARMAPFISFFWKSLQVDVCHKGGPYRGISLIFPLRQLFFPCNPSSSIQEHLSLLCKVCSFLPHLLGAVAWIRFPDSISVFFRGTQTHRMEDTTEIRRFCLCVKDLSNTYSSPCPW